MLCKLRQHRQGLYYGRPASAEIRINTVFWPSNETWLGQVQYAAIRQLQPPRQKPNRRLAGPSLEDLR
ncbi:hypothetical protein ABIF38_007359 [Bradyrhizobium japonicum]|jgi:hypothetical protein|uniref:Transposase n=1 Tax=Bradyrhizobium elkanii TaxID=29448 RepID=A0ABV4EYU3_BRAEL|nr:hypothetical protein [Bradyrhizobium elkanii]MCS4005885.1 hypothetical protein [Bradyrhizobium elkanii USDA 61]MCP1757062.1 hypothetical protein [Bradyrhizobium elkanii]MCP1930787.1 hypothetical protein [Bradyrhizobium elkanii]MCP1982576.1 hypothetical protein [Bradyrhizobium elkanii]